MRKQLQTFTGGGAISSPAAKCQGALPAKDLAYSETKAALVACFVEIGDDLSFDGGKINRVSALDLLHETRSSPTQDRILVLRSVWQAINGNNEPDSPYRRMIAGVAPRPQSTASEIDNAARDVGINPRRSSAGWYRSSTPGANRAAIHGRALGFHFHQGEADRMLATDIPRNR